MLRVFRYVSVLSVLDIVGVARVAHNRAGNLNEVAPIIIEALAFVFAVTFLAVDLPFAGGDAAAQRRVGVKVVGIALLGSMAFVVPIVPGAVATVPALALACNSNHKEKGVGV